MPTTTVSSKGQITLPAALVRERGLVGKTLSITETDGVIVLVLATDMMDLAGALGSDYYGDADSHVAELRDEWE
jgi:bifunctional DNA-binding transcriptional regulator/antitoxin component of YhaV-PrlF toxin-antitoxin module